MFNITVSLRRHCMCTADGRRMIVFPAKARIGKENRLLHDCRGIKESDVQINLRQWIFYRRITLTPEVKEGITEFLGEYSTRDEYFDCYAFVNLVFNIRPHRAQYLLEFWDIKPLTEEPKIGEAVFLLTQQTQQFHHAAIYLGYQIYLSVYGADGDLEFATLMDMKRDYGAADIVLATPRPRRSPMF